MIIAEPLTTLTDYAIAVEATIFAIMLNQSRQTSVRLWAAAFAGVAIAALLGGTLHGFVPHMELGTRILLWKGTLYLLGLTSFLLLAGTVISSVPHRWHRWMLPIVGLKSFGYLGLATVRSNFAYVVADYLSALVIVLLLQLRAARRHRAPGAPWILAGVLVSGVAVAVLRSRLALPFMIRSVDLYHVVQMVALYLLYRGVRQLRDVEPIAYSIKNPQHEAGE
ncbi:hypothetical protein IQ268_24400 [Oculatella sp. LEGE 06141]|uniref:DUF6962 family protein n=1 Tax=Oculatella sp. LEGE 06141 TaxID=1828648 RepID=UPI00187FC620|nr:hypothetical protein [Oculatella sp. LEGE 06141]MBE9181711.1 hypothetical protein [Oculatella sp. LEGE 06141]